MSTEWHRLCWYILWNYDQVFGSVLLLLSPFGTVRATSTTYVDTNITSFNRRYHPSRIKTYTLKTNIDQSASVSPFSDIKRKGFKINGTDFLVLLLHVILWCVNVILCYYELNFTSALVPGNVNWRKIMQYSNQALNRRRKQLVYILLFYVVIHYFMMNCIFRVVICSTFF